jgi:hypothetical protein
MYLQNKVLPLLRYHLYQKNLNSDHLQFLLGQPDLAPDLFPDHHYNKEYQNLEYYIAPIEHLSK